MRYQDRRLTFLDGNGREGLVYVRVFQREGRSEQPATVIVSALAENPGMSPCTAFEELAPQLVAAFGLSGSNLRYIEHWGPFSYEDQEREEEFSLVHFSFDPNGTNAHAPGAGRFYDPSWKHISVADVEGTIVCGVRNRPQASATTSEKSSAKKLSSLLCRSRRLPLVAESDGRVHLRKRKAGLG